MRKKDPLFKLPILLCIAVFFFANPSFSMDVVKVIKGQSAKDVRIGYKHTLLRMALEKTVPEYGPFTIDASYQAVSRDLLLRQMIRGELTICFTPANPQWESQTHPIYIPIRKGLLNYRLLMVNKQRLSAFKGIKTAADLKQLTVGLRAQWITTLLMKGVGFKSVEAEGYDDVFIMLNEGKSDFIPRGVNEIYDELAVREKSLSNLTIEPHLAIYLPMPVYIYVSPKAPRIKTRIKKGLNMMIEDGSFDALFMEYYGESIKRAKLHERKIIRLSNPFLTQNTPFSNKKLWFDPIHDAR